MPIGCCWADAWGEMGFVYHAHGLLEAASTCYRNAGALAPQDVRWPHSLGALERERGRLEPAKAALEKALELAPGNLPGLIYLGDIDLQLGNTEDAARLAQQALEISDSSPAVLDLAGRVSMHQQQYETAIDFFEFALAQVPEASRLNYELGMAYRALGDLDKAREQLAQSGKIGVKAPDRLLDMIDDQRTGERLLLLEGRRAFNAGDYSSAAAAFQRAVDAEPESLRARVNLASALAYSGSAPQAVEELNYVLEKEPDHEEALFNLGAIYRASGDWNRAVELLTRSLDVQPEDLGARYELGLAYRGLGQLETALDHLEHVALERPMDGWAQHYHGDTLARLGRYQESLQVLKEAYQLQPENGLLAHGLARLLAACPDPAIRNGAAAVDLATRVGPGPALPPATWIPWRWLSRSRDAAPKQRTSSGKSCSFPTSDPPTSPGTRSPPSATPRVRRAAPPWTRRWPRQRKQPKKQRKRKTRKETPSPPTSPTNSEEN